MQIDVGFGDIVTPEIKEIEFPSLLGMETPQVSAYSIESVVAEKFEAALDLADLNSRMKDFYDIWLMMRQFEFKGPSLVEAIKKTFKHRKTDIPKNKPLFTDEIYDEKSDRQTLWNAFLKKGDIQHAPDTLSVTAKEIETFLVEPIIAINEKVKFDKIWKSPRGWK